METPVSYRWPDYGGLAPAREAVLSDRRVLVTGASGFLGVHLVRRLAALGAVTHALSRSAGIAGAAWTTHRLDLCEPHGVADLMGSVRPDIVFHLAGEASGSRAVHAVLPTLANNLQSTVNVLRAAALSGGPRVVLAGSMEEPRPDERASSPYAMSKRAAAGYEELFHELWSLPTVRLRIAMAYGPAQRDERKLIPYVVSSLLRDTEPELTSGTRKIDWVYVDDVVDAFIAAASVSGAVSRAFDVGSGAGVDIRRTVELVRRLIGTDVKPRFGALADRPHDTARIADLTAVREVLGWRPAVGLEEGLRRTIEWYREHLRSGPDSGQQT